MVQGSRVNTSRCLCSNLWHLDRPSSLAQSETVALELIYMYASAHHYYYSLILILLCSTSQHLPPTDFSNSRRTIAQGQHPGAGHQLRDLYEEYMRFREFRELYMQMQTHHSE